MITRVNMTVMNEELDYRCSYIHPAILDRDSAVEDKICLSLALREEIPHCAAEVRVTSAVHPQILLGKHLTIYLQGAARSTQAPIVYCPIQELRYQLCMHGLIGGLLHLPQSLSARYWWTEALGTGEDIYI